MYSIHAATLGKNYNLSWDGRGWHMLCIVYPFVCMLIDETVVFLNPLGDDGVLQMWIDLCLTHMHWPTLPWLGPGENRRLSDINRS